MTGRGKAGGRAQTWPPQGTPGAQAARPQAASLTASASFGRAFAEHVRAWAAADAGPGRLFPWLPVAFGSGIALYFAAEHEPQWWAPTGLAAAFAIASVAARRHFVAFVVFVGLTAVAAGFAAASLKALLRAHAMLDMPQTVTLSGFVEMREERERSDRVVLRVADFEGMQASHKPERVRIAVRKGTAPAMSSFVALRARLNPPLQPLRPGGYDFARDMYFRGIGASGFALGAIRVVAPPAEPDLWLRFSAWIGGIRDAVDRRIRAAIDGDRAAIASALVTGQRGAISATVSEAFYVSSLAHVLAISGYHMAVVAGIVFFVIRALLALVPGIALAWPIKKWAALGALFAGSFYLLLSGASVSTQRALIMTAIVLVGVMADRAALTLRTIAIAALAVLVLQPEALLHPSFQMSFAAALALIAGYQLGLARLFAFTHTSLGARVALFGGHQVAALVVASLLAGLATTPFAAYHFHRLAPYGVLANLLAMPIVSLWIMPAGLLGVIAIPFGLDGPLWRLMGGGIDGMIAVAVFVAGLPGAVGRIGAFGTGTLLLCSAGFVLLCLLRSPLRLLGAPLALAAALLAVTARQPDILVSADGELIAARNAKGRLAVLRHGRDDFALREWLAADADGRNSRDPSLQDLSRQDLSRHDGGGCDDGGCVVRQANGLIIAAPARYEALAEDCRRAALIITALDPVAVCGAMIVDRRMTRETGAAAARRRSALAARACSRRLAAQARGHTFARGAPRRHAKTAGPRSR
jgi:competence protein ComEC